MSDSNIYVEIMDKDGVKLRAKWDKSICDIGNVYGNDKESEIAVDKILQGMKMRLLTVCGHSEYLACKDYVYGKKESADG